MSYSADNFHSPQFWICKAYFIKSEGKRRALTELYQGGVSCEYFVSPVYRRAELFACYFCASFLDSLYISELVYELGGGFRPYSAYSRYVVRGISDKTLVVEVSFGSNTEFFAYVFPVAKLCAPKARAPSRATWASSAKAPSS